MESEAWNEFSEDYDQKVFSLTSIPQRRKQIIRMMKHGKILNIGCGSAPYLNKDLVNLGTVIASDFCKAMLDAAERQFVHPNLYYVLADSRQLPFADSSFDYVVSANSILPPERSWVYQIGNEISRVLKKGGSLIAFLPSYDNVQRANSKLGVNLQLDEEQLRVMDTTGWQCFHTPDSIADLMQNSGFSGYDIMKVFLSTRQEIAEFKRLYGFDTSKSLIYEYLLTAHK